MMWRFLRKRTIRAEVSAESETPKLTRRSASLSPTIHGAALAASGRAVISEESEWQRFLVEVTANVVDGTEFTLIVNGRPVAPMVISDSEGVFEIGTSEGLRLPNGLNDVGRIETLAIATQEGIFVLTGAFARDDRLR